MGNRWDVTREVKSINEQQDNGRLQSGRQLSWLGRVGVRKTTPPSPPPQRNTLKSAADALWCLGRSGSFSVLTEPK